MTRFRSDWDFGFSSLTKFFYGPWRHERTALETVGDAAEGHLDDPPGAAAEAILEDTLRLLESPLSTEALTTIWLAASGRGYNLPYFGIDTRDWLRQIIDVSVERLRQVDPAYTVAAPEPAPDTAASAVLDELRLVAPELTAKVASRKGYEIEGVVPALEQVVTQVDPDLGFRLFLRTLIVYRVPISEAQYSRYEALGERFGYGEFHVSDTDWLRDLPRG
ncbi:hypothetical protein [Streptomyces sp. NPDC001678]|uniref:hypothetical protein n=1 Tax=Streptomyces sp. NPDC001678 TaxID=3364599 RepID=UPI0036B856B7